MEEATHDELAGVVDLFGALTRDELEEALVELAFRRGQDVNEAAVSQAVEEAIEEYYLVAVEGSHADADAELLLPGPVAFPTLPDDAEDLPHILDVPEREVDRDAVISEVADRLRADAEAVVEAGDTERANHLYDVTYDLEAWGDVDLADVRDRLDEVL